MSQLIPLGIHDNVPIQVVNLLLEAFKSSGYDYSLVLGSPTSNENSPIKPAEAPIPPHEVKSFDEPILLDHIWVRLWDLPDPVSKSAAVVLSESSKDEPRLCIFIWEFPGGEGVFGASCVVAQFDAVPIALDLMTKGSFDNLWPLRNIAALNGGYLTAQSLRQVGEAEEAERTRSAWKHITNLEPQATRDWDNDALDELYDYAAFCIVEVPDKIKADFVQQAHASECHVPNTGPYIRFVDSVSMAELQVEQPEAGGASSTNPFLSAPLEVIDDFVKQNFPGSKLNYNRYFIFDKYTVNGDFGGGNSCVVVFNEDDTVLQDVPGPKAVRMKFGQAYEEASFLDLISMTFGDVTEHAHRIRGIVDYKMPE